MNKLVQALSELFEGHTQYMMLAIYIMIGAIAVTFIINFISGGLSFLKYLPGLILILVGIFSLFSVINALFKPESLDNIIIFVIAVGSGLVAIIFAAILGTFKVRR